MLFPIHLQPLVTCVRSPRLLYGLFAAVFFTNVEGWTTVEAVGWWWVWKGSTRKNGITIRISWDIGIEWGYHVFLISIAHLSRGTSRCWSLDASSCGSCGLPVPPSGASSSMSYVVWRLGFVCWKPLPREQWSGTAASAAMEPWRRWPWWPAFTSSSGRSPQQRQCWEEFSSWCPCEYSERVVWERCVCVWQSCVCMTCVTKFCVKDCVCVWQSSVWKIVCDKVACERLCVAKWSVSMEEDDEPEEPQTRTPRKDVGNTYFTIWLFNIAMENGPFLDDFPIKASIYKGFSMAMLNNQMVYHGFLWPGISSSLFGFLALEWSSGYFL